MTSRVAGTRQGITWHLLWALAGLVVAWLMLVAVSFVDIAVDAVLPVEGVAKDVAIALAQAVILALATLSLLQTVRRRTQVSRAFWVGPAALAAYGWAMGLYGYVPGYYAPLVAPAVLTAAFLAAWLMDGRGSAASG